MKKILITQSLFYGGTWYIFREVGNDQYKEIELRIDRFNERIICNEKLTIDETNFIYKNILQGEVIISSQMNKRNRRVFETFKKTYHEHSK